MAKPDPKDMIELLACDIVSRPAGAPMPAALARQVRRMTRTPDALVIEFAAEAAEDVAAFAAAESICCASIGWNVERSPTVRLTITAAPDQLTAIGQLFTSA